MIYAKKFIKVLNEEVAYTDEGEGEVLLFLHGNYSSSSHYHSAIEKIKGHFRCVAPDMPGFGDTSYNDRIQSMEGYANFVYEFAKEMKIEKAKVVAWSAGCGVALELAVKHPEFVSGIFSVAGSSHKGYPIYHKDENFAPIAGKIYDSIPSMTQDPTQVLGTQMIMDNKDAKGMTDIWNMIIYTKGKPSKEENDYLISETLKQRHLVDMIWALCTHNMSDGATEYTPVGTNTIKDVKCPCVFTMGDCDITVPEYMIMENVNAIPQAKLVKYTECGHSPFIDCFEQITDDIIEFAKN